MLSGTENFRKPQKLRSETTKESNLLEYPVIEKY
jgi:hypothetical protein